MAKPRKLRVEFRKNRSTRRRSGDLTRAEGDDHERSERISGKGDLTRKRTVVLHAPGDDHVDGLPVESAAVTAWRGRVLNVHGLESHVQADDDGRIVRCTMRRLLRTVATEQRHPLTAGDWVRVGGEGAIQSIEPRSSSLSRDSRGRRHVIVANVDQVLVVGSAAQPDLKPGLIDRLIVAAESSGIRPLVCLNKVDLVEPATLVPLAGVFARMGYPVILCSAVTGMGVARLHAELRGRVTALVGQSGVGKSSLLNALDPDLDLRVAEVSRDNEKGRHTTTTARLLPHRHGGWFVDTPGVRQFQPWQLVPAEVPSAFRDLRPIANLCRFPDCTHDHETGCAVKDAVADGLLDVRRWESCRQLAGGDEPSEEDE
ncbi:MAG: ribosome small subunit-dependent GTPase A [Planctomycetes bacterium]|nr:ribosome small subunit-dependent GTPase A [Planctomycetota bacterium]